MNFLRRLLLTNQGCNSIFYRNRCSNAVAILLLSIILPASGQAVTGVVRGTVTSNGVPLAGAAITILEMNRSTTTDQSGKFEIQSVPEGKYALFVRRLGYENVRREFTLNGESITLDITLEETPIASEEIVVSASPYARTVDQLYQSAESRGLDDLASQPGSSFAEKLANVPGVSVRYNGSGPARPVIRGLSDERVLMLENGLRTGDLSTFDPAHAVPVEPNSISQIDVVRGPSSIIYGPNTIGGLVNVLTNVVPAAGTPGLSGTGLLSGNSVSDEYAGSIHATYTAGENVLGFMFSGNHAQDLRVPTSEAIDPGNGQLVTFDQMPASYHRTTSVGAGYRFDNNVQWLGGGWKNFSTTYGVPGFPPEVSKLEITKDLFELHSGLRFSNSFAKELRLSGNFSSFKQNELPSEEDSLGVVHEEEGNKFEKKTVNATLQLLHQTSDGVQGTFGLWFLREELEGEGEEILAPNSVSTGFAGYVLEEYAFSSSVRAQLGLRFDGFQVSTSPNEVFLQSNESRTSNSFSASLGTLWRPDEHWATSLTVSRSFRPPTVLELFSFGVDAPVQTFDIGEPGLEPETGLGVDFSVKGSFEGVSLEFSPYINYINKYVYGFLTGAVDSASGLDVRQFAATDARLTGFEASLDVAMTKHIGLLVSGDYVESQDRQTDDPLPFTPPLKGLARLSYVGPISADVEVRGASDQTRLGIGDTPTPGYAVVNAGLSVRFNQASIVHTISVHLDNVFDRLYRDHLSVIKDFMPMPGRGARLTYLVRF